MSEIKSALEEAEVFEQWVEQYRKGKPYWSTARVEICRDTWMERAKHDVEPVRDITDDELDEILREHWNYQGVPRESHIIAAMRAAIAKATGSQS